MSWIKKLKLELKKSLTTIYRNKKLLFSIIGAFFLLVSGSVYLLFFREFNLIASQYKGGQKIVGYPCGPDQPVGTYVNVTTDQLTGISLQFATYQRRNTNEITFHLKEDILSTSDIRTGTINASVLKDNQYRVFTFEPIYGYQGKQLYFYIESLDADVNTNCASVWGTNENEVTYRTNTVTKANDLGIRMKITLLKAELLGSSLTISQALKIGAIIATILFLNYLSKITPKNRVLYKKILFTIFCLLIFEKLIIKECLKVTDQDLYKELLIWYVINIYAFFPSKENLEIENIKKKLKRIFQIVVIALVNYYAYLFLFERNMLSLSLVNAIILIIAYILQNKQLREKKEQKTCRNKKMLEMIAIIFLTSIGFALRIYNVGDFNFHEDEFQVVGAAKGYLETGEYYTWDWMKDELGERKYARAWPHSWIISQSFDTLGVSEFSARLPSVICGTLLILVGYVICKWLSRSVPISLLFATFLTFYPPLINLSRYTRMYIFFILFYLLTWTFTYKGLSTPLPLIRETRPGKVIRRYFDFNFLYLAIAGVCFLISYLLHVNSMIMGVCVYIFAIYKALTTKKRKFIFLSIMLTLSIFLLVILPIAVQIDISYIRMIKNFITIRIPANRIYWNYILDYPFQTIGGALVLVLSFILAGVERNQYKKDLIVFLNLTIISTVFFFVHFANRYASFVYSSNLVPIFFLSMSITIIGLLGRIFSQSVIRISIFSLMIGIPILLFLDTRGEVLNPEVTNFKESYKVIEEQCIEHNGDIVIFGQYLRSYYLGECSKKVRTIDMQSERKYLFDQFLSDLKTAQDSTQLTLIVYNTHKAYHIVPEIISYVKENSSEIPVEETVVIYKF